MLVNGMKRPFTVRSLLRRRRIAVRFFWICTGTSFLMLILFGMVSFLTARQAILQNSVRYVEAISEQAAINLGNRLKAIEDLQHDTFANLQLYRARKASRTEEEFGRVVSSAVASLWASSSNILAKAYFIDLNGDEFSATSALHFQQNGKPNYVSLDSFRNNILGRANWRVAAGGEMVMNRVLISLDDLKEYGYVQIMPRGEYLDVLHDKQGEVDVICLKDDEGGVWINHPGMDSLVETVKSLPASNGSRIIRVDSKEYLVVMTRLTRQGLTQYCLIHTQRFLRELWTYTLWSVLACGVALFGVIVLFFLFTRPVASRMQLLLDKIRRLAGPGQTPEAPANDDFFEFSGYCDALASQMETMIADIYEARLDKQAAELKSVQFELSALQSQINPHFLYNTLESIGSSAKLANANEASEAICILAELLRACVQDGNKRHCVRDEVNYIERYLYLQRINLGDHLTYRVDVDEACERAQIPKMLLQPLVENSIVHGIENAPLGGTVCVDIVRTPGGKCRILIADNGVGMDEQAANNWMRTDPEPADMSAKVGLSSVYKRLKILYGDLCRMDVASEKGRGTVICILIPLQEVMD